MRILSAALAGVAVLGLAACADQTAAPATTAAAAAPAAPARPADPPVPVFDMNGQRIGQVPAAMVRGTPHGIPILVNRGGQNITVTVGSPPNPGTVSAGRIGRVGSDTSGRVVVERQNPRGDLSPAGTPRFVGTGAGGAPIFTFE